MKDQELTNAKAIYMNAYEEYINAQNPIMQHVWGNALDSAEEKLLSMGMSKSEITNLEQIVIREGK